MKQCVFHDFVCVSCGVRTDREDAIRACPFIVPDRHQHETPGLGDRVASALAAVGITKERAAAVLGDCGCKQRQQWLNEVGHRIGIGTPNIHETGNTPPPPPPTAPTP